MAQTEREICEEIADGWMTDVKARAKLASVIADARALARTHADVESRLLCDALQHYGMRVHDDGGCIPDCKCGADEHNAQVRGILRLFERANNEPQRTSPVVLLVMQPIYDGIERLHYEAANQKDGKIMAVLTKCLHLIEVAVPELHPDFGRTR